MLNDVDLHADLKMVKSGLRDFLFDLMNWHAPGLTLLIGIEALLKEL